jgi:hypothetical protein
MLGIIGGSGFEKFEEFETIAILNRETPFGLASSGFKKSASLALNFYLSLGMATTMSFYRLRLTIARIFLHLKTMVRKL